MTQTNIAVAGLESYQPAVDYRRSGRIGVLSGSNFAWDASGVYSGYASRLVAAGASISISPFIVQDLDLEVATHIVATIPTGNAKVWRLVPTTEGSPIGTWELITSIPTLSIPDPANVPYDLTKWTTGFLGNKEYAASFNYGVFRVNLVPALPTYTRLTSGTVPGFPVDADPVVAICETNGRMIYMTRTTFYWSGANNAEDLVPALGGAGFQIIGQRIAGVPFACTPVANGCIIWTSTGALVCEFIGGDSVFRYWELTTQALPISSFAITRLPNDDYVILTRLGLYKFENLSSPAAITPLFNEFLREFLRSRPNDFGHVWYSITENRLYVTSRTKFQSFPITYALDIMMDRWGIFNEPHIGFFMYGISRGQVAYANQQGIVSFLLSPLDERKNRENPANPGQFIGLASNILIGWMRPENMIFKADVVQEVQEIAVNRLTPNTASRILYTDEGFVIEVIFTVYDEGFVTAPTTVSVDEGIITEGEEIINYRLRVVTDLFNFPQPGGSGDSNVIIPFLVKQAVQLDLWVTTAPTAYARLQFLAETNDEFYRVNSLDLTVAYDGEQA